MCALAFAVIIGHNEIANKFKQWPHTQSHSLTAPPIRAMKAWQANEKQKPKAFLWKHSHSLTLLPYVCVSVCMLCMWFVDNTSPNTVWMKSIYFMVSFKSCFTIKPSDTCCAMLLLLLPPTHSHHLFHFYLLFACAHCLNAHECASCRVLCVVCLFPLGFGRNFLSSLIWDLFFLLSSTTFAILFHFRVQKFSWLL